VKATAVSAAHAEEKTPRYLTVRQLADLLQVNVSTITRLAARDASFPVLRISGLGGARGVLRFPADAVEKWLAARTVGTTK
jgi:predicted DNA-binding transcriptional regulator AlpA